MNPSLVELPTSLRTADIAFGRERVPYAYGYDCAAALGEAVAAAAPAGMLLLVADERVAHVAADMEVAIKRAGVRTHLTFLTAHESTKTISTVQRIAEEALGAGLSRSSGVVSIGGGLTENVAGMVAGLCFRGLDLIHLATTPVGAFDAVLSRKQAVNLDGVKNTLGMFRTPRFIGTDLRWLVSIEPEPMMTGLAEIAKNVIAVRPQDAHRFVRAIERFDAAQGESLITLLEIGIAAKAPFLMSDPDETREALVFEYGHTVGHAIEAVSGGRYSHGQSVGWGMLVAADIAVDLYGLDPAARRFHDEMLTPLGITRAEPPQVDPRAVVAAIARDNKRGYLDLAEDAQAMVLLEDVGKPVGEEKPLVPVPGDVISAAVDGLLNGGRR